MAAGRPRLPAEPEARGERRRETQRFRASCRPDHNLLLRPAQGGPGKDEAIRRVTQASCLVLGQPSATFISVSFFPLCFVPGAFSSSMRGATVARRLSSFTVLTRVAVSCAAMPPIWINENGHRAQTRSCPRPGCGREVLIRRYRYETTLRQVGWPLFRVARYVERCGQRR